MLEIQVVVSLYLEAIRVPRDRHPRIAFEQIV